MSAAARARIDQTDALLRDLVATTKHGLLLLAEGNRDGALEHSQDVVDQLAALGQRSLIAVAAHAIAELARVDLVNLAERAERRAPEPEVTEPPC